jgi:hypothetical protein
MRTTLVLLFRLSERVVSPALLLDNHPPLRQNIHAVRNEV